MAEHPHAADFQNAFLRDIVLYIAFWVINTRKIKRKNDQLTKNKFSFYLHKSDFFFSFQVDCFFFPRPIKA